MTATLSQISESLGVCSFCPFIVMLTDEISYLFDIMYDTFRYIILGFLVVFGTWSFAQSFGKGFDGLPFKVDFSGMAKGVSEKMRLVMIASVLALIPPKIIFSFTFEPIMQLSFGVANTALRKVMPDSKCDANTVVDSINSSREKQESERVIPPAVKLRRDAAMTRLADSQILDKEVVGGAICQLSQLQEANGRQLMLARGLFLNGFNFKELGTKAILAGVMGALMFALFFMINLYVAFYILDAFLDILVLAIKWPFMVFGYAFDIAKFKLDEVKNVAVKFGSTIISLAIFTMFNIFLIDKFAFGVKGISEKEILDKAIATNDFGVVLKSFAGGIVGKSEHISVDGMSFEMPVKGAGNVTSEFGIRSNPTSGVGLPELHTGVDFGGAEGTPIYATLGGKVIHSGANGNYGISVDISHNGGYTTRYGHLSKTFVKVGEAISAGKQIGLMGSTGRATGVHLHYELRKNGVPMNPFVGGGFGIFELSQFLFIIFAMFYIYSKLGEFVAGFGGSIGDLKITKNIQKLVTSAVGAITSVEKKGVSYKKDGEVTALKNSPEKGDKNA